jgi:hypothetical protein
MQDGMPIRLNRSDQFRRIGISLRYAGRPHHYNISTSMQRRLSGL